MQPPQPYEPLDLLAQIRELQRENRRLKENLRHSHASRRRWKERALAAEWGARHNAELMARV